MGFQHQDRLGVGGRPPSPLTLAAVATSVLDAIVRLRSDTFEGPLALGVVVAALRRSHAGGLWLGAVPSSGHVSGRMFRECVW